jgi:hypothetical protein
LENVDFLTQCSSGLWYAGCVSYEVSFFLMIVGKYERNAERKLLEARRSKQMLRFEITGHLSWAPSEVTCRNEEHLGGAQVPGNIISSASGDYAHLRLNQNLRRGDKFTNANASFCCTHCVLVASKLSESPHFATSLTSFLFLYLRI